MQGIEEFYYRYEYPYIREIHILLKSYRRLLKGFHRLSKQEPVPHLGVFSIVIAENKKYSRILTEKSLRAATSKKEGKSRRKRERQASQPCRRENEIDFALEYGYRKRRTNSQKDIQRIEDKKSPTELVMVNLLDRKKTHWTTSMRSNTEYTSTREQIESRPHVKESITSRGDDTSENKSRVSSRRKVMSRRTLAPVKHKTREIVKENDEQRKVEFGYDALVETETHTNDIKSFYELIKDPRKEQPPTKVYISNR